MHILWRVLFVVAPRCFVVVGQNAGKQMLLIAKRHTEPSSKVPSNVRRRLRSTYGTKIFAIDDDDSKPGGCFVFPLCEMPRNNNYYCSMDLFAHTNQFGSIFTFTAPRMFTKKGIKGKNIIPRPLFCCKKVSKLRCPSAQRQLRSPQWKFTSFVCHQLNSLIPPRSRDG